MKLVLNGRAIGWILLGILIAALAVYVWPTVWTYPSVGVIAGDQIAQIATRVNRFNGKVQYLTLSGWMNPTPTPPPAPTPTLPAPSTATEPPQS